MMGQQASGQERLFYAFSLEDHVPQDHPLRGIDACLNLDGFRDHLAEHYSHTGRPSIDPELMIRMLIIGYSYGIRSERRLCEEVHLNLAYRWFCRLSLEDSVPHHSSFSKNRHGRFRESGAFRWVFDEVVRSSMNAGLIKGEGFAVDASLIAANASHQHSIKPGESYDRCIPYSSTRPMQEYLASLDDAELALPTSRKVSLSDPHSRWTAAKGGVAFFSYSTNYLIDSKHGMILDVEATASNRVDEVASTKIMVDRVEQRFNLKPERLIADTAYGSAAMLGWMVDEKSIAPHMPIFDKGERKDGSLSRSDFAWIESANEYVCPSGKKLKSEWRPFKKARTHVTKADTTIFRASALDCVNCALKPQCCPNTSHRKIPRSIHEHARDIAREIAKTPEYITSCYERKKVEMLFAHLKSILKLDRLRLRGLSGATDEFTLAALTQNLRRMAKLGRNQGCTEVNNGIS